MIPSFPFDLIDVKEIQSGLRAWYRYFLGEPVLKAGFKFKEETIQGAQSNYKIRHNYGNVPKDIIVLNVTGGSVTFLYGNFDRDYLYVNTTASTTVRFLYGRYEA